MTAAQYAPAVKQAGVDLGISEKGIVIGFATVFVESGWVMYANASVPESTAPGMKYDAIGSDGASVGLFQQQVVGPPWWWGDAATCMDPYKSAQLFFTRLAANTDYNSDANTPGSYAQAIQQSAYPDRYDQEMASAQALYNSLAGSTPAPAPEAPVTDPNKPGYNEFWIESPNSQDRSGTVPRLAIIHTQEPTPTVNHGPPADDAAEGLGNFCANSAVQVSYHDYISQASDGGVTVVDGVDTDLASWSVGDANDYSINYCFAGSYAGWTRDDWLKYASNAIDVVAYLIVQDAKKYGFPVTFLGTGGSYNTSDASASGVTDHRFVTDVIGWGTHTDVGPGFPADVFAASLAKYSALDIEPPAPPAPPVDPPVVDPPAPPAAPTPVGPADDQIDLRWNCLGGQTLVEAVAEIRDKLLGTNDRPKVGAL